MKAIQIIQAVLLISSALAKADDDKIVGGQPATQGQFPYQVCSFQTPLDYVSSLL